MTFFASISAILILVVARTYVPAKMDVHKGAKDVLPHTASVVTRKPVPSISNARRGLTFSAIYLLDGQTTYNGHHKFTSSLFVRLELCLTDQWDTIIQILINLIRFQLLFNLFRQKSAVESGKNLFDFGIIQRNFVCN